MPNCSRCYVQINCLCENEHRIDIKKNNIFNDYDKIDNKNVSIENKTFSIMCISYTLIFIIFYNF